MSALPAPALAALLGIRLSERTLDEVLQLLVEIARDSLPDADDVSITLVRGEKPFTAAATDAPALAADELQYARGHGPSIDAGVSATVLISPDLRAETRWPDYAAAAVRLGVLASLSVPLPMQTEVVGALNCYSRTPTSWSHSAVAVELAAHVAVAVGNAITHDETARFAADMQAAMLNRAVIEQAKGVIMAQNRCDPEAAFAVLRQASMGRNVKLRDLAGSIVAAMGAATALPT